jgi:hypothetical protein
MDGRERDHGIFALDIHRLGSNDRLEHHHVITAVRLEGVNMGRKK